MLRARWTEKADKLIAKIKKTAAEKDPIAHRNNEEEAKRLEVELKTLATESCLGGETRRKDLSFKQPVLAKKKLFLYTRSAFVSTYGTKGGYSHAQFLVELWGRHISRFGFHDRLASALSSHRTFLHDLLGRGDSC
jgi:hypothetical protein